IVCAGAGVMQSSFESTLVLAHPSAEAAARNVRTSRSSRIRKVSNGGYRKSREASRFVGPGDMRTLQEIARGDRVGEAEKALLETENLFVIEARGGGGRDFGGELQNQAARRLEHSIVAEQGQSFKMFVEP